MPHKDPLEYKAYRLRNKERFDELKRKSLKKCKEIKSSFVKSYKEQLGCAVCGERSACCLNCHHLEDKSFYIAKAYGRTSIEKIQEELTKCEIICCNCQIEQHYNTNWRDTDIGKYEAFKRNYCLTIKELLGCYFCNLKEGSKLEFHHLDPKLKKFTIGASIKKNKIYLSAIKEEIKMCEVLCKNCHCKLHNASFYLDNPRIISPLIDNFIGPWGR